MVGEKKIAGQLQFFIYLPRGNAEEHPQAATTVMPVLRTKFRGAIAPPLFFKTFVKCAL
jgi:hypothetical protein